MSRGFTPPAECPVCGEDVPLGAKACPGCGADERSGWNEDATVYDGIDLPDDEESSLPPRAVGGNRLWIAGVVLVLVLLLLSMIFR